MRPDNWMTRASLIQWAWLSGSSSMMSTDAQQKLPPELLTKLKTQMIEKIG